MHLIMLVIALFFLAFSILLKKREAYLNNNWNSCSGKIVKIEEKLDTSSSESEYIVITTIRYELKNRVFEFQHNDSLANAKIGMSIELLYSPNNIKKVAVKEVGAVKSYKVFLLLSVIPFGISYKNWQPITLSDLTIFFMALCVIVLITFLKVDFLFIKSLLQPLRNIIENEPENATEIAQP